MECAHCGKVVSEDVASSGCYIDKGKETEVWLCNDICFRKWCAEHPKKSKKKRKYDWYRASKYAKN